MRNSLIFKEELLCFPFASFRGAIPPNFAPVFFLSERLARARGARRKRNQLRYQTTLPMNGELKSMNHISAPVASKTEAGMVHLAKPPCSACSNAMSR